MARRPWSSSGVDAKITAWRPPPPSPPRVPAGRGAEAPPVTSPSTTRWALGSKDRYFRSSLRCRSAPAGSGYPDGRRCSADPPTNPPCGRRRRHRRRPHTSVGSCRRRRRRGRRLAPPPPAAHSRRLTPRKRAGPYGRSPWASRHHQWRVPWTHPPPILAPAAPSAPRAPKSGGRGFTPARRQRHPDGGENGDGMGVWPGAPNGRDRRSDTRDTPSSAARHPPPPPPGPSTNKHSRSTTGRQELTRAVEPRQPRRRQRRRDFPVARPHPTPTVERTAGRSGGATPW